MRTKGCKNAFLQHFKNVRAKKYDHHKIKNTISTEMQKSATDKISKQETQINPFAE